jgi:hypothetical protein
VRIPGGVEFYKSIVVSIDMRYTELYAEGNTILNPKSKLFTDWNGIGGCDE